MAIVQISRITNRKGLQSDLPQLAGAELGWSVDERRLFIGNGTIAEGAPVVGNTEILTEFSDILAFQTTYTYKGAAAGYVVQTGASAGTPVSQSLQSWMDQWASVKDFGAVGDGVTDDTDAINRALYQLYCREVNPQIRRSLFFPAGVYLVNETIVVPSFATLYGEGKDNSVIVMAAGDDSALRAYVARTGDSLQQTGSNIGSNGAITPRYITIRDLGFETLDNYGDVFLIQDAENCTFNNVNFMGPLTTADLDTDADNISGVRFASTASLVCQNIVFDGCTFTGTTYGINTDQQIEGVTICNSKFDTLFKGIVFGELTTVLGGPTGVRIVQNIFDNVYAEGILFGDEVSLNATGYNIFYDVGNHFNGLVNPATSIIVFQKSNNISVSDMFARQDIYAVEFPRINVSGTSSIGFVNGEFLELGSSIIETAPKTSVTNNNTQDIYEFDSTVFRSVTLNYSFIRSTGVRTGTFAVAPTGGGTLTYNDDYTENESMGITLFASQTGDTVKIRCTTTDTGDDASMSFSITTYRI